MNRNYCLFFFTIIVISSFALHAMEDQFSAQEGDPKIGTVEVMLRIAAKKMKRSASQEALGQNKQHDPNSRELWLNGTPPTLTRSKFALTLSGQ